MNILSLFSGVGGMDLGLERAGHNIVAMCEIDPHARNILAYHWPDVPIHEDVTTLDGSQYAGRIDLVSGGSPCQDLSVAGQRQGLDGARSGLFWHQCRIADQAAARWVLWENVPGALSSNGGADFAAVLWGFTGAHPRVPDGGWNTCGVVVGPKRWAVWRVLDAQWFGVAQRRRRIFVVAGAGVPCRPEILFESEGMFGGVAPSRTPREAVAALTSTGVGTCGADDNQAQAGHLIIDDDRRNGPSVNTEVTPTLTGRMGTGGNNMPMTFVKAKRARSDQDDETWEPDRPAPTLNSFDNGHETRATVLAIPVAIRGRDGGATAELGEPELANTLRGSDGGSSKQHVLAIHQNQRGEINTSDIAYSLNAGGGKPGQGHQVVYGMSQHAGYTEGVTTLTATDHKRPEQNIATTTDTVRRLTPIECERLMGWPDNWTATDANGKQQADSHRYRQIGNGVAAPVTQWIGNRLH